MTEPPPGDEPARPAPRPLFLTPEEPAAESVPPEAAAPAEPPASEEPKPEVVEPDEILDAPARPVARRPAPEGAPERPVARRPAPEPVLEPARASARPAARPDRMPTELPRWWWMLAVVELTLVVVLLIDWLTGLGDPPANCSRSVCSLGQGVAILSLFGAVFLGIALVIALVVFAVRAAQGHARLRGGR